MRVVNEGGLRGPLADLITRVQEFGFPTPDMSSYPEAIDRECAKLIKGFPLMAPLWPDSEWHPDEPRTLNTRVRGEE